MDRILTLKAIISSETDKNVGQATLYLVEEKKQYILPITIDTASAESILLAQQQLLLPRPHTHDLIRRVITGLKGSLIDVIIYDLQDDIFYAYLRVQHNNTTLEIDARPSDAIAMALRFSVPILATEQVMAKGSIGVTNEEL